MTVEEKVNEQDVQKQQLEKIFSLLNQHESDVGKMSENDLQNQLKMYKQQESSCSQKIILDVQLIKRAYMSDLIYKKTNLRVHFTRNLAKLLQFIKLVPALNNFFIDTTNYGFWSIFWTKNKRLQNLEKELKMI